MLQFGGVTFFIYLCNSLIAYPLTKGASLGSDDEVGLIREYPQLNPL